MFQQKKNIISGRNPVIEALKGTTNIDKILLFKNASGEAVHEIRTLAQQRNIPIQYVPNEKLNALSGVQHQGVVAFKTTIVYQNLEEVIAQVLEAGQVPLFLMLDGVTDVRNIGAIARSALCCGAQAIIIPDKGVGALQEDAVKSSAGALEQIHICRVPSLLVALETCRTSGIMVYASEMKATTLLHQLPLAEPTCFVLGNEEKGVANYMSKAANQKFAIPMAGNFDSLNVSVAAGIMLYEALKQRL